MSSHPPNKVLFVYDAPTNRATDAFEALFRAQPGFVQLRYVHRYAFIEFEDVEYAKAAMNSLEGHKYHPDMAPLRLDYDRDAGVPAKRKRFFNDPPPNQAFYPPHSDSYHPEYRDDFDSRPGKRGRGDGGAPFHRTSPDRYIPADRYSSDDRYNSQPAADRYAPRDSRDSMRGSRDFTDSRNYDRPHRDDRDEWREKRDDRRGESNQDDPRQAPQFYESSHDASPRNAPPPPPPPKSYTEPYEWMRMFMPYWETTGLVPFDPVGRMEKYRRNLGPDCATLFLRHLPPDISTRELTFLFSFLPNFNGARVITKVDSKTRATTAMAFVDFVDPASAYVAMVCMQGYYFGDNLSLHVEYDKFHKEGRK